VILDRAEHPSWLSNSYLLADEETRAGVLVDGHGEGRALLERIEREGIRVERILLTHHHGDHVDVAEYLERFRVPVVAHPLTAQALGDLVDETLEDGDLVQAGGLRIRAIHTPGHAAGHLALLAGEEDCLTADVLFRGTVGGTRAPGATGFADLRASIMDRLLTLPPATRLHPGHREPTTVADELQQNPFVRIWRGLDPEGDEPCTVRGEPARLVLWAPDYDGTNKAWVRFGSGEDAVVGGSQVRRG
jgi:glyoxylase-like metal-dependent hydrolase (beta-lactamase superfamily II)